MLDEDLFLNPVLWATLGGFLVFFVIFFVVLLVVLLIGKWKFFKKAGQEGWKAIIPFYSDYVLACDIAGLKWWWFLILISQSILNLTDIDGGIITLAACAEMFATANVAYNLSKKLNKSTGWIVLATLFNPLMIAIEGYSSNNNYDESIVVSENGFIDSNK